MFVQLLRIKKEKRKFVGYTIPKGWKILVWNRGVHMDPEIYLNPKEFEPSRWEVSMIINIEVFFFLFYYLFFNNLWGNLI